MSVESQSTSPLSGRPLRPPERDLIERMLATRLLKPEIESLMQSARVEDMQDGGMGSIRFLELDASERRLGGTIAEAEYVDEDGVVVTITINVDQNRRLYELDFWKVDFSPLTRYPRPSAVVLKSSI